MEKSRTFRPYLSFAEREYIEKQIENGEGCGDIARALKRSFNTISVEVKKAGREKYSAHKGQDLADKQREEQKNRVSAMNKGNANITMMKGRIEHLEMQVEILFETIKGLMK
jgi:IS30 family transposase